MTCRQILNHFDLCSNSGMDENICSRCHKTGILNHLKNFESSDVPIDLGTLDNLNSHPDCPLCRFFLYILSNETSEQPRKYFLYIDGPNASSGYKSIGGIDGDKGRNQLDCSYVRICKANEELPLRSTPLPDDTKVLHEALLPWLESSQHLDTQDHEAPTQPSLSYLSRLSTNPLEPRKIQHSGHQISVSLIRSWLQGCEKNHRDSRFLPVMEGNLGFAVNMLLIDVVDRCLVHSTTKARYVALSYVWGGTQGLQTKRCNVGGLKIPSRLMSQSIKPPLVIQDAIIFVQAIGERFLWVDSLCIVQDDQEQKHLDIHRMDIFYGNAIFTITAVPNKHAATILHGVRPETRRPQAEVTLGDLSLVELPWGFHNQLVDSLYEHRAWTMQERMLSTRYVHFTTREVFFQCHSDFKGEIIRDTTPFEDVELQYNNPIAYEKLHRSENDGSAWEFSLYRDLVYNYIPQDI